MALIICPECGKQVSDQAVNCPGCGYPISTSNGGNDAQQREISGKSGHYMTGHLIAIISIVVAMAASVLPFFTYSILGIRESVNLWHKGFLGLTIVGFILLIAELIELATNKKSVARDTIILGILFIVDISIQYVYNSRRLANFETGYGRMDLSGLLQPGVGFYLIVLASVGMIVAGIIMGKDRNS